MAVPLQAAYLDETALVFHPKSGKPLPNSIFLPGKAPTYASDINRACLAVHSRQDEPLVYLPGPKICLSLTELFDLAREFHPQPALSAALMRDRQTLLKGLETETLMVMQAKPAYSTNRLVDGVAAAETCSCPYPIGDIFDDGFESLP